MTVDGMTHMEDVVKYVERAINKSCCAIAIKNSSDNFISEA